MMDSQLSTLSKIFTERLFRIPDYQRGYAWTEPQLNDFWNDLKQIEGSSNHYTGVITLEAAADTMSSSWDDDSWIIQSKSYEPFYVVDGQQRLTTSIILIEAIIEIVGDEGTLNYSTIPEIRKKYVFDSKDSGISRSYIFGYDKDNPSYEFLKTKIFQEYSFTSKSEETVYTNNLDNAKSFFLSMLKGYEISEIEDIFRKVTQHLLFNIFTISEEVDVCVAFETMNNRGKPLSYLELLKNRLIYLSLKMGEPDYERKKLRTAINDCWKEIYHSLGRNKDRPLIDDLFLNAHYLLYFSTPSEPNDDEQESKRSAYAYRERYLARDQAYHKKILEELFIQARVGPSVEESNRLKLNDVYVYVRSLQESVKHWFYIFNPLGATPSGSAGLWLDRLDRMNGRSHLTLALAVLLKVEKDDERTKIFKALEKYLFVCGLGDSPYVYYSGMGGLEFIEESVLLYHGKISPSQLVSKISERTKVIVESKRFINDARNNFKSRGFYLWPSIRYFLFEYNLDMQERSKTDRAKINWSEFTERRHDYKTVEHIYPQNARSSYWIDRFSGLTPKQRDNLRNSLGNLLPLSQGKNSSLSNRPFPEKVEGKKDVIVGFRYGCYAENEVAKELEWNPSKILARGLKMLSFMEKRWGIDLGTEEDKAEMLGLEFVGK